MQGNKEAQPKERDNGPKDTRAEHAAEEPHREPLRVQVLDKMGQLIAAAFGLVAALAWNDAIKGLLDDVFPSGVPLRMRFLYAVGITALAVVAGLVVAGLTHRVKRVLGHGHPGPPTK